MASATSAASRGSLPRWAVIILGLSYVIMGLLLIVQPLASLLVITIFIGASWFVSGLTDLFSLFRSRERWFWTLISGAIGVWAGLVILSQPLLSTVVLPLIYVIMIGVTGLFIGGVRIVQGLRGAGLGVIIWGVVTIILSFWLLSSPLIGVVVLPFAFGATALAGGIMTIIGAFRT